MEIQSIRRRSLAVLVEDAGGQDALADKLGVSGSYVSQLVSAGRPITEKTARKYEALLSKPPGWMDVDHSALRSSFAPSQVSELVNLLLALPPDEAAYWIRTIAEHPRR